MQAWRRPVAMAGASPRPVGNGGDDADSARGDYGWRINADGKAGHLTIRLLVLPCRFCVMIRLPRLPVEFDRVKS